MQLKKLTMILGCSLTLMGCFGHLFPAKIAVNADLQSATLQMMAKGDIDHKVAQHNNPYAIRLHQITQNLASINGIPLNYKVYLNPDRQIFATPDGSIRVYSGLMDLVTDEELLFIVGHELGHIAKGHSVAKMHTAYDSSTARQSGAVLADQILIDLFTKFMDMPYSQEQELAADDYGLKLLKTFNYSTDTAASALLKLESNASGLLSSHPNSAKRIKNIEKG